MSDEYSYGDDGPAYGDDGPAYGDDGPAYGDEGPSYGDNGASYDDEITYGDEGPIGEGQPAYDEESGYAADGYAPDGYDETQVVSEDDTAPPAAKGSRGPGAKRLALIGAAVLGLVGVGGAGYMMFAGDGDPLAMLRDLPVVGEMLGPAPTQDAKAPAGKDGKVPAGKDAKGDAKAPAPAAEPAEGAGWLAPLWALFPGGGTSDEALIQHDDNLSMVNAAIMAYDQEHHALPGSPEAIKAKLQELGMRPVNPYSPGEALKITKGDQPAGPGAMAYVIKKGAYQLRVADRAGQPLKIKGVELVLDGTGSDTVADDPGESKKPTPKPSAEAAASSAAPVAALPSPKDAAKGIDSLGGVIPAGASPLPSAGLPGSPPPVVADGGLVPLPGSSLSPRQVFELRVKRNREFDFWRIKGITLVYSKRTAEALDAFKKALAIRPNDESVTQWVNSINDVIDKRDREAKEAYEKEKESKLKEVAGRSGSSAAYVPPPPAPIRERPAAPKPPKPAKLPGVGAEDASKMLDELKKADKVPMLAPPKLDP